SGWSGGQTFASAPFVPVPPRSDPPAAAMVLPRASAAKGGGAVPMFTLQSRGGRLLWGGLIGLAVTAATIAIVVFCRPAGLLSQTPSATGLQAEQVSQVKRDGIAIVVPSEVVRALGIHTIPAKRATQPRTLPALAGCLALDS